MYNLYICYWDLKLSNVVYSTKNIPILYINHFVENDLTNTLVGK